MLTPINYTKHFNEQFVRKIKLNLNDSTKCFDVDHARYAYYRLTGIDNDDQNAWRTQVRRAVKDGLLVRVATNVYALANSDYLTECVKDNILDYSDMPPTLLAKMNCVNVRRTLNFDVVKQMYLIKRDALTLSDGFDKTFFLNGMAKLGISLTAPIARHHYHQALKYGYIEERNDKCYFTDYFKKVLHVYKHEIRKPKRLKETAHAI